MRNEPPTWKDFALLLLYDHIALVVNSSMMVYCKDETGQLDLWGIPISCIPMCIDLTGVCKCVCVCVRGGGQ